MLTRSMFVGDTLGSDRTLLNRSSPVFPHRRPSTRTRNLSSATWTRESRFRALLSLHHRTRRADAAATDLLSIGCITTPKDFVVAGTATDKLYGVAEGLWEPDLVSIRSSSPFFCPFGTLC
jgi:hypothetical protein